MFNIVFNIADIRLWYLLLDIRKNNVWVLYMETLLAQFDYIEL